MINCIIIEDQGLAQEILQHYIEQTEMLQLIGTFIDLPAAIDFMEDEPVDLLFLDISLPKMSGMDFLRKGGKTPITILTTAYSEFALECYEYNVIDYLLKPFSYERFSKAINKLVNETDRQSPAFNSSEYFDNSVLYVKAGTGLIRLYKKKILFIKACGDYTEVFTSEGKHLTSHSLKEWIEKLDGDFVQVHRSYIIHLKYLQKVVHNKIYLGKEMIPIGRVYRSTFLRQLKGLHSQRG